MNSTWLHVSDFHFRAGDPYGRDVVLHALVRSVQRFRENDRARDLIFGTGDIGNSGKDDEYEIATRFFDDLIAAGGLDRRHLFVVPGNHDVDRTRGVGLARTLGSREEADAYFGPDVHLHHLTSKQGAFLRWYNRYFDGIRSIPEDSSCGPVEAIEIPGGKIGILPINSALFCQDENDHAKLCVGRRCLDAAINGLNELGAELHVVLLHHPLDWLHDIERSNIRPKFRRTSTSCCEGISTRPKSKISEPRRVGRYISQRAPLTRRAGGPIVHSIAPSTGPRYRFFPSATRIRPKRSGP